MAPNRPAGHEGSMARTIADGAPDLRAGSLPTPDGGSILVLEAPALGGAARADVVILPAFGKRAEDLFLLSHYLRRNGFHVLRFDPRNHAGRGTGQIVDFRLSALERDLTQLLRARPARRPLILLGVSLSAPVAWKYAASAGGVAGVATLVGVVDVPGSVERATGASVEAYRRPGAMAARYQEPLGRRVLAGQFVRDMDVSGYGHFEATCADALAVEGPVHLVAAGRDQYVDIRLVERLAGRLPPGSRLELLERSTHRLGRSVAALRRAFFLTTELCLLIAEGGPVLPVAPSLAEVVAAARRERAFLRGLDAVGTGRAAA